MSAYVQGIWSTSISPDDSANTKRWLQGDACSGILLNLNGPIYLDKIQHSAGVILLPVSKEAHSVTLPPGSQLAGIRFHPGISFGVFRTLEDKPAAINDCIPLYELHTLASHLVNISGHHARIVTLYKWLNSAIDFSDIIPSSLVQALNGIQKTQALSPVSDDIFLSQRQLERQFQKWLGMTPKHYQRVLRVKRTLSFLKQHPYSDLVRLALDNNFSDQAHMTREFKQIAKITPGQYSKRVAGR